MKRLILLSLKKEIGRKPAILTIMKEYSDSYVLKNPKLTMKLSLLKDNDSRNMQFMDLVQKSSYISISASEEEVINAEKQTWCQSSNKQCFDFRARRIRVSNMKGVCNTHPSNPSQSLIKKICYLTFFFLTEATKWDKEHEGQAKSDFYSNINKNMKMPESHTMSFTFQLKSFS
jgi:hypothetical protein